MQCQHFGACGSCRRYDLPAEVQLKAKHQRIAEAFTPHYEGTIDLHASPDAHYRARAEFRIWHEGETTHYAMNHISGHGVVTLAECPKVTEPIAAVMPGLLEAVCNRGLQRKLFGIDFLATTTGEVAATLLYHRPLDKEWETAATEISETLGIHIIGRSKKQKVVIGQDFVTETLEIAGRTYGFEQIENSFTQPNPRVNEQMIGWALQQFGDVAGDLLELYCGAGNFTIPFASRFDRVLATEISKSSIKAARNNMALNGVENIDFVRMSAEEFVQAMDGVRVFNRMQGIDLDSYALRTLFVDPPRAGMDEASCDFASRFERILYISCNPETLLRDVERLAATHRIVSMGMFDQFPYTDHLEMGVMLIQKEKEV